MSIHQSVPTIDISSLLSGNDGEEYDQCITQIADACQQWGFFYISQHGISKDTIQSFRGDMDEFFHLPPTTLENIKRTQQNSRGYFDDELTKNKLDWKRCFDFGAQDGCLDNEGMDGRNQWPSAETDHKTFQATMTDYFHQMERISRTLLGAICASLDMHSDALQEHFDGVHTSYLRLNYYPKCPDPQSNLAVHHHTDAGALTVLYQDEGVTSLQVLRDGTWHFLPPREGTFVINIGDMVQVWSNDRYKAPLHQVQANSSKERYSAPFFYNPAYKADVEPLVLTAEADAIPSMYKVVNWGEFRSRRFAGDYANIGEEVQISHYRISV